MLRRLLASGLLPEKERCDLADLKDGCGFDFLGVTVYNDGKVPVRSFLWNLLQGLY